MCLSLLDLLRIYCFICVFTTIRNIPNYNVNFDQKNMISPSHNSTRNKHRDHVFPLDTGNFKKRENFMTWKKKIRSCLPQASRVENRWNIRIFFIGSYQTCGNKHYIVEVFLIHFVVKTIGIRKRRFDRSTVIIKQSEDKNLHKY